MRELPKKRYSEAREDGGGAGRRRRREGEARGVSRVRGTTRLPAHGRRPGAAWRVWRWRPREEGGGGNGIACVARPSEAEASRAFWHRAGPSSLRGAGRGCNVGAMLDNYLFGGGVFLFIAVVGIPLLVFVGKRTPSSEPVVDSPPAAYWAAGGIVASVAAGVLLILVVGFILPAYGVIGRNRLTEVKLWIPAASRSREPATLVTASDLGASWLLAAIAAVLLIFGLFLIGRGFVGRARRAAGDAKRPDSQE